MSSVERPSPGKATNLAGPLVPGPPTDAVPQNRARRRRRRRGVILGLAGLVAIMAAWLVTGRAQVETRLDNQELDTGPDRGPAPDFALPSLADPAATIALADYRGEPAVVNFWASWCVPCRREMPRLAAAARRLEGEVAFVGVNYRDDRDDALALVEETAVPYPSGVDDDGAVGTRYGLVGMPTTVFVSPDGQIAGRYLGEMSQDTGDGLLDQLVAAR